MMCPPWHPSSLDSTDLLRKLNAPLITHESENGLQEWARTTSIKTHLGQKNVSGSCHCFPPKYWPEPLKGRSDRKEWKRLEHVHISNFFHATQITLRQHKLSIPADVASSEKPAGPTNRHSVQCGGVDLRFCLSRYMS